MYKLISEDGKTVQNLNNMAQISEGGQAWQEYQEWLAEGNTPEPQYNQEEAMNKVVADIGVYADGVKAQPFYYAPFDANFYLETTKTVKAKSNSSSSDIDWKTADKEPDGVKTKKIKFKKNELEAFNDYSADREYTIGVAQEMHVVTVQDMFLNGDSAETILDYDFTTGWPTQG